MATRATTEVSVVIATYQRRDAVRRALVALGSQTVAPDSYEVIISIDGSRDGTRELVASHRAAHAVHTIDGPRRGRAAALNAAIARAGGEILIVLDDDMEAAPELIERHRSHHLDGARRCVLGGVPVKVDPAGPRAAAYIAYKFDEHLGKISQPGHVFNPYEFYTGNVSLRTDVMREIGAFDETFVVYGHEDVELFIRLVDAGVTIGYDASALAQQGYDKELRALARDRVEAGRTAIILARMHPGAIEHLPLTWYNHTSRRRMVIRSALLALTRRVPKTSDGVFALAATLERAGLWRSMVFYEAVLDYAYWCGADAALRGSPADGRLAGIAADTRRGPIDLLLHR